MPTSVSCGITRLFAGLGVVAHELEGEGDIALLLPAERQAISHAVPARRSQFASGRLCARACLRTLGRADEPLLIGPDRRPRWPEGVEGSISHTTGLGAAAVAMTGALEGRGIGLDVERTGRVRRELLPKLFGTAEIRFLEQHSTEERTTLATMMFGAKEAFYKAQFPRSRAWVGFHDVEVVVEPDGVWVRRVTDLEALDLFRWPARVRYEARPGFVVTGVVVEPARQGR